MHNVNKKQTHTKHRSRQQEKTVAFMDMGTNSMRLMLAAISPNQTYSIISRQKEMIRLGAGEFSTGYIQKDAMDRAVLVSRNFVEMAHSFQAQEIVAVATSATRDAKNQAEFITRLKNEAGLDIRVISGSEEARLIYLGVSSGIHLMQGKALFIDIGGGSTELVVGNGKGYDYLDSLKLGAIRLSMLHLPEDGGPVSPQHYQALQHVIRNSGVLSLRRIREFRLGHAYGSSGTIQNLAHIASHTLYNGNPQWCTRLRHKDLQLVSQNLCRLSLAERQNLPGMIPRRADIIVAGAAILDTLMEEAHIPEITISNRELRDGLLVDYLARMHHPLLDDRSVRQKSVLRLGRRCLFDEPHAMRVARLALELFDSAKTSGLHTQGGWKRELLYYAALLHDTGTFLSYAKHHANSAFFIRNSDMLGFNQTELAIMAATAFYHRKALPSTENPGYEALDEPSREIVRINSMFLRIAESLDRSHAGLVASAQFTPAPQGSIRLEILSGKDCQMELWGVQKHAQAFEKTFGRALSVMVKGTL